MRYDLMNTEDMLDMCEAPTPARREWFRLDCNFHKFSPVHHLAAGSGHQALCERSLTLYTDDAYLDSDFDGTNPSMPKQWRRCAKCLRMAPNARANLPDTAR